MDPNGRARRNRGRLSESRAAGQQGQDSDDRKDSTDFHCNAPSPIPFYLGGACEYMPLSATASGPTRPSRAIVAGAPWRLERRRMRQTGLFQNVRKWTAE